MKTDQRIFNGEDSRILPYQVRLKSGCGGTIIKLDWILTAKHCLQRCRINLDGIDGDCWTSDCCEEGELHLEPQTILAGISNLGNFHSRRQHSEVRTIPTSQIIVHKSAGQYLKI